MKDDYLWDGSGEPDPEVKRLELLLSRLRSDRPAPQLPLPSRAPWFAWPRLVAAAAVVVLVVAGVLVLRRPEPAWQVARLEGAPRIGGGPIGETGRMRAGQWLETDATSRAKISVGTIGVVEVGRNTRIGLVNAGGAEHRMALARGSIRASIWAPPRQFFVNTPAATAVDLGCAYRLDVDDTGAGLVRVLLGWVGFENEGRESFIPAGAHCATRPGKGPGTPYFEDVSVEFRESLKKLDFESAAPEVRSATLEVVLAGARPRDGLTLWHLLSRVSDGERPRVFERMAALVPLPGGVTREGVLRGDRGMMDLWWNALGLGDTSLWREWKRSWPKDSSK